MTGAGITLAYPSRREHAPAGAAVREPSRRLPSSDSRTAAERKPAGRRIPVLLSSGAQLAGDGWKTHAWRCERECLETVEDVPTCAVGSRIGTLSGCSERARRRRSAVCAWCRRRLSSPAKRAGLLRATSRPDRATGVGSAERPPWGRLGACRGTARLHQDVFRAAGCHLALGAVAAVVEPGGACGVLEHAAVRMAVPAAPRQQRMYHGPHVMAGGRQLVEVPASVFGVGTAREDAVFDKSAQPVDAPDLAHRVRVRWCGSEVEIKAS